MPNVPCQGSLSSEGTPAQFWKSPARYQSLATLSFYKKKQEEKKIPHGKCCSHKNAVAFFSVTLYLKVGTAVGPASKTSHRP